MINFVKYFQRRHKYEQKVTIPSYLLAIVVAKISSRVISPRCSVWAEEQNVEAAAWEFGQVLLFHFQALNTFI